MPAIMGVINAAATAYWNKARDLSGSTRIWVTPPDGSERKAESPNGEVRPLL